MYSGRLMLLTVSPTLIALLTLICHSPGASAADTDQVTGDDHAHSRFVNFNCIYIRRIV